MSINSRNFKSLSVGDNIQKSINFQLKFFPGSEDDEGGSGQVEKSQSFRQWLFKFGHHVARAANNINHTFGDGTVNERTAQHWFRRFRSDDTSLQNEPRVRPQTTINEEELKALVELDTCQTMRELANKINVHYSIVSRHLKAIDKVEKLDKWTPPELTENHQTKIVEICSSLFIRNKNYPIFQRTVTCNEEWILYDNLDSNFTMKKHQNQLFIPRSLWSVFGVRQ
ncbi:histone-lysine N-methyltransferase SETMAR-like [Tachypleus tridentatus]|uniref:histone-lysine N-methyltransferase SETMAR-like n=1 Tax=Tachypleus tridentatus TaxID=6853 RepID=UPI003FD0A663